MAAPRRTSQHITLLMLVLASLTILTLDYHGEASRAIGHVRHGVSDVLSPFQRAAAAVLHPFGQAVAGAVHYGSLQEENQRLTDALGTAQRQLAEERFTLGQYDAALAVEHLPFVGGIPTVAAEVISGPASNVDDTVELDQGTSSGVGPGMPVVAGAGLVGTVVSASSSTSTVELIEASKSTVPAATLAGGLFEAAGNGAGRALSLELPSGPVPKRGDRVYTSALALGAYPAGIPLAVVSAVSSGSGGATQQIAAQSLVDLNTLQYVSVVQWLAPA